MHFFERFNRLFPVWAVLLAVVAAWQPPLFTGLAGSIKTLLVVIMFAMGLTLSKADFARVVKSPVPIAVALASQFFSATAALPGALFSVWHNVSGSLLAGWWKRRPAEEEAAPALQSR